MLSYVDNVKAILECHFPGFKGEIIDNACTMICKLKGYVSIEDVMSIFDDFMRGDIDENDTETFLNMLRDKLESEK